MADCSYEITPHCAHVRGAVNVTFLEDETGHGRTTTGEEWRIECNQPVTLENRSSEKDDTNRTDSTPPAVTHVNIQKWLLLLAAILCRMLSEGYAISMGVFFVEFLETFGGDRGVTVWAVSLAPGIMYGAGVPTSLVVFKTNERVACVIGAFITCTGLIVSSFGSSLEILLVFFGVVTGIGMSFITLCYAVAIDHHFNEGKGAALAICEAGSVIGGLGFPVLLRFLIDTYGWRGAVLISAGILLNMAPLGILFVSRKQPKGHQDMEISIDRNCEVNAVQILSETYTDANINGPSPELTIHNVAENERATELNNGEGRSRLTSERPKYLHKYCDTRIWKSKPFVSYVMVSFTIAASAYFPYAVIVDIGATEGYGKASSTYLVTAINLASVVGIAIMAGLLKLFWKQAALLYILNTFLICFSLLIFPRLMAVMSYETLVVAVVIFGLSVGGLYGTYAAVVAHILGTELYTLGFGFVCSAYGLGITVSAPIAGWLHDLTGDYDLMFYIGGGMCLFSVLVFGLIMLVSTRRERTVRLNEGDGPGSVGNHSQPTADANVTILNVRTCNI